MEEVDLKLRFSNWVNVISVTYYRLTRVGTDFLECCARDDLAKLKSQQEMFDKRNRELLERWARDNPAKLKSFQLPTEKEMTQLLKRLAGDDPKQVKNYLTEYGSKGANALSRKFKRSRR